MQTIVGLGGVGCRLANCFEQYPQYSVAYVNNLSLGYGNEFIIPKQENPEKYEESFKFPENLKTQIGESVLLVLSGSSSVSSVSLRLLQVLNKIAKSIKILYIRTESDLLSKRKRMQDRVVFSVLQEYTRSGLFKEMTIIKNDMAEKLVENASITEYYPTINNLISSTYHMLQVLDHQQAVVSNMEDILVSRRINTIGLLSENNQEKMFYDLDITLDTVLYYGICESSLNEDKDLQRNIIKHVKEKTEDLSKYSYGVYETKYNSNFCYVKKYTSKTQDF